MATSIETKVLQEDDFGLFQTLVKKISDWRESNKTRQILSCVYGVEYSEDKKKFLRNCTIRHKAAS